MFFTIMRNMVLIVFVLPLTACDSVNITPSFSEGPKVHILSADRATGLIEGYVVAQGSPNEVSLTLDGAQVTLGQGLRFSTTFDGNANLNTFVAEDAVGRVTTVTYAKNTFVSNSADKTVISARINNNGFSFLGDAFAEAVLAADYGPILESLNPVLTVLTANVYASNPRFELPTFDITLLQSQGSDMLRVRTDIPNLVIDIEVDFLLLPTAYGTVSVDHVIADTDFNLQILNSDLEISSRNTEVRLDNLVVDINGVNFLDLIVSWFADNIVALFLDIMTHIVDTVAVPLLSEFVREIPISLDLVVDGHHLNVNIEPTYLEAFDNGVTTDLDGSVIAPQPDSTVTPALGYVYVAGEAPTISVTAPNGSDYDIGKSISANFINQTLLAAHEAGITTLRLRSDNTAGTTPEGVAVFQSQDDDIQQSDLISMNLIPASPPYLVFGGGATAALGTFMWHDVTLQFEVKRAGWQDYRNVFSTTFNVELPFELDAQDGFLVIGLEKTPEIFVTDIENAGIIQLSPNFINGVLKHFLPVIMPAIAEKLKAVPLPRIAGYSVHPDDFWVSGTGNNTLSLAGSMVLFEETAAAPEPTTLLNFASSGDALVAEDLVVENLVAENRGATSGDLAEPNFQVDNGEVTIEVSGVNPSAGSLDSRYRVDNGAWSVWKQRSQIQLNNLLGGSHVVEVCSRTQLMKVETNCPTISFDTSVVP